MSVCSAGKQYLNKYGILVHSSKVLVYEISENIIKFLQVILKAHR